jgi:hypothetical protein
MNDEKELNWAISAISEIGMKTVQRYQIVNGQPKLVNLLVKPKQILEDGFILDPKCTNPVFFKHFMVIPKFCEIENIIMKAHLDSGHAGYREAYSRIKCDYLYITRQMCSKFKERCVTCQKTAALKDKKKKPLIPIDGKQTFHRVQLDLIDYRFGPAGRTFN